jgi:copper transport protein
MTARRTARLFLLASAVAIAYPAAAFAHANLVRSDPAAGAVLANAPSRVRLVFDDVIQLAGTDEVIRNSTHASALAGKPRLDAGGKVMVLPLKPRLGDGDYTVRWQLLSDDGHFESGVLAFGVGAGRAPPRAALGAGSSTPSAGDVVSRWLLYAGLLVAAGAVAFWLLALRPAARTSMGAERARALERVERGRFAALVLAGSVLYIAGAARFAHELGWDTRFGAAARAGALAGVVTIVAAAATVFDRRARPLAAVGAVALAAAPSFGGHALDAGVPWPNVVVDLVHVYAAAVWIGALVGVLFVLPAASRAAAAPSLAPAVVRRVSVAALVSVAVIGATGTVRAVYELRALHQLWTTGYGRALLVKTALLVVLVAIGWLNRRRLADVSRITRRVRAEVLLLVGVVVAIAFLTQLRPGRDAPRALAAPPPAAPRGQSLLPPAPPPPGALVLAREAGPYGVALALERHRAHVIVLDPSGGGASGLDVAVDGRRAAPCGRGCYAASAGRTSGRISVAVAGRTVPFAVPARAPAAAAAIQRATRVYRALRSVAYLEHLSSGQGHAILTRWRVESPDRAAYVITGGPQAVIIGGTRWDRARAGGRWQKSEISPLELPEPVWGDEATNAHMLAQTPRTLTLSWANPSIPAFFTATFDRRALHPLTLRMTAAAHFMQHRYLEFNGPRTIRPPR